ncbi:hypothetical protein [Viridibacillus arvi]|uniref:hypothetical protein n=1 Tax=Viridibacillus arvi TaxID=263475 RepID=UPI0034CF87B7
MIIWLFVIALAVVQVIGLMTYLHFNSKMKILSRDNRRMKLIIKEPQEKSIYEELGLTKEEYENSKSTIYAMNSDQISLYDPYALKVIETADNVEVDDALQPDLFTEFDHKAEETNGDELSALLGIKDPKELEEIQKEISKNTITKEHKNEHQVEPLEVEQENFVETLEVENKMELKQLAEDLEEIIQTEGQEKTVAPQKKETFKKTSMGKGEDLYFELTSILSDNPNEINNEEILFSDVIPPIDDEQPIFLMSDANIPFYNENDIPPVFEEQLDENLEHEKMINMLNLLDKESSRLDSEVNNMGDNNTDKEKRKQELAQKLAILADEGEGKKNMQEIVFTLIELYKLEGKETDMKAIQEEYKEYFMEEDINLRIYEEDIIRIGKDVDEPETFEIPKKYLWMATNQITDEVQGEQRWVGKCIGKNQQYIHFRDVSQRIWINVGEENIVNIELGDLLAVFVNREEDSITANCVQHINKS